MDFKLQEIEAITNNFAEAQKVGSGGYGDVYRATHEGQEIAVKKLHQLQGLDHKQFHNEIRILTKISHKNVIRLIGYCHESRSKCMEHKGELIFAKLQERALCFEYMQGGSLEEYIADEPCRLDWPTCYKIIQGTCDGLNHLHNAQEKAIFHLDLKPSHILLDKNMTPKIAGLGLSRLDDSAKTHTTEMCDGTPGYMPPEYVHSGLVSKKFDVFSLGVIIVKMVAGNMGFRRSSEVSPKQFIELVSENWKKRLHTIMSPPPDHKSISFVLDSQSRSAPAPQPTDLIETEIKTNLTEAEEPTAQIDLLRSSSRKIKIIVSDKCFARVGDNNSSMDFTFALLDTITNSFSEERKIGSGGYGDYYRAVHNGEEIAVKKLHQFQGLDDEQFDNEINSLTKVSHKNVIRLIGYCHESRSKYVKHNGELIFAKMMERLRCFEYMQGGSLDKYITDEPCGELDWRTCYKIIQGTSEGLNHLHNAQEKIVFHLDLSISNILLDKDMTPKIAGFGLSTLVASTEETY